MRPLSDVFRISLDYQLLFLSLELCTRVFLNYLNALPPDQREVRYSVISGFIFLRFFAPAILGPKLFDITTHPIVSCDSLAFINYHSSLLLHFGWTSSYSGNGYCCDGPSCLAHLHQWLRICQNSSVLTVIMTILFIWHSWGRPHTAQWKEYSSNLLTWNCCNTCW